MSTSERPEYLNVHDFRQNVYSFDHISQSAFGYDIIFPSSSDLRERLNFRTSVREIEQPPFLDHSLLNSQTRPINVSDLIHHAPHRDTVLPSESASQVDSPRKSPASTKSDEFLVELQLQIERRHIASQRRLIQLKTKIERLLSPFQRTKILVSFSNDSFSNERLLMKICQLPFDKSSSHQDFLKHFHQCMLRLHESLKSDSCQYPTNAIFLLLKNRSLSLTTFCEQTDSQSEGLLALYCLRTTFSFNSMKLRRNPFGLPGVPNTLHFHKKDFSSSLILFRNDFLYPVDYR
jgi:hypothetical protein